VRPGVGSRDVASSAEGPWARATPQPAGPGLIQGRRVRAPASGGEPFALGPSAS
jgi:hypothetical protein